MVCEDWDVERTERISRTSVEGINYLGISDDGS